MGRILYVLGYLLQKRNVVVTCISFVYLWYIKVKCPFKRSMLLVSIKHRLGLKFILPKTIFSINLRQIQKNPKYINL